MRVRESAERALKMNTTGPAEGVFAPFTFFASARGTSLGRTFPHMMGKRGIRMKAAYRQTRLDNFIAGSAAPAMKRPRVDGTSTPAATQTTVAPTRRPTTAATIILSSRSPSPAPSATASAATMPLSSVTSLTASARASVASLASIRSVSPSSSGNWSTLLSSQSSTASYTSTTSVSRSPKGRTATAGKGPRSSATRKSRTYLHNYDDLLTPPAPVPSPNTLGGQHPPTARWGELSVILPWAARNTVRTEDGRTVYAWPLLLHVLKEGTVRNVSDLRDLMQALLIHHAREPRGPSFSTFRALCTVVDSLLSPAEQREFFDDVLPFMRRSVVKGPRRFQAKRVAVLRQQSNKRVLLSGDEAFTLMCCAFFSLFPGRSASTLFDTATRRRFGVSPKLPASNYDCLFSLSMRNPRRWESALHKIRCVLQYFFDASRARHSRVSRCLEVCRVSYSRFPEFAKSTSHLQPFDLLGDGLIEGDHAALQVDFANRILGGGVLGQGCVQEEIRFVISPELMLSRLVAEPLLDHEAVFVTGAKQHSYYQGYADTFRFAEPSPAEAASAATITAVQSPMRDSRGHRIPLPNITVVAMDAVDFHSVSKQRSDQYTPAWVNRECMKAFVSFYGAPREYTAAPKARRGPIATGNWGCGAFGGDVQLKLLIQWCAASEAGRRVRYYAFDRTDLIETFPPVYAKLLNEGWTVGDLFRALRLYGSSTMNSRSNAEGDLERRADPDLFEYLLSCQLKGLRNE